MAWGHLCGLPIACAAALAVLEVIEEERLNQKALAQGEQIKARLHQLATRFDCIGNIRGPGAMVAMELVKEGMPPDRTRISPSGWWPRQASGAWCCWPAACVAT